MAKEIPSEIGDGGLGDITGVMNNQSVSDLRWLSVCPEEYREFEALPKQNLDTIPELTEFLTKEPDEKVPSLVIQRPITVVNSNPLDTPETPSRASVIENIKKKVASYVMMNMPSKDIEKRLTLEYSPNQIRSASTEITEILNERGLLGNVYINASHFPPCNKLSDNDKKFLNKFASKAKFLLSKDAHSSCICNNGHCIYFKKRVVSSIPYTRPLLASFLPSLINENRLNREQLASIPTDSKSIRSLLQLGFSRSSAFRSPERIQTIQQRDPAVKPKITEQDVNRYVQSRLSHKEELPKPHVLNVLAALSNGKYSPALLASSDPDVRASAREYGIIGHTYLDMDVLGGPKKTMAFIKANNSTPDFIVSRVSYEVSTELTQLGKICNILSSRPALTINNVGRALVRAYKQGRISRGVAVEKLSLVKAASSIDADRIVSQINLYKPPQQHKTVESSHKLKFYHGDTSHDAETSTTVIPEEVRRTISHFMNTGLHGQNLQKSVLSRYSRQELTQVPEVGSELASVDGIQGVYHLDPSAYADYGKGCNIGSKLLKSSSVRNIIACNKCTGCKLQTAPGWCSKYARSLIRSIPESVRIQASQKRSLPVVIDTRPIENPVERYELATEMDLDLNGSKSSSFEISIDETNPFE